MNNRIQKLIARRTAVSIAVLGLTVMQVAAEGLPHSTPDSLVKGSRATTTSATGGPAFTLESATISKGGGVLPDGSIIILGQTVAGTATGPNFTMELGAVPMLTDTPSCPVSTMPVAELIGSDTSTKNRFLSFAAGDPSTTQAIRVSFDSLPPPYDLWSGAELWVGPASQVTEAGAIVTPIDGIPSFTAATLQCEPFYAEWALLGTVHVFHEGIIPDGSYRVAVINESEACSVAISANFSDPLPMATPIWGDTVLDLAQTPPQPPEGAVNVVDALGVLGAFSSADGAITKARGDLEPRCLDLRINVTDVLASLSGFSGLPYPFTPTAADPCDSTCTNVLP